MYRAVGLLCGVGVGVVLGGSFRDAVAAPIAEVPEAILQIDSQVIDITSMATETQLGYRWGVPNAPLQFTSAAGDEVSLYLFFDQDPAVSYSIGVTDTGSPSIFSFTLGGAIVPTGSPNQVLGSIGGTLTDPGQNGVALSGLSPNPIQRAFLSGPSDPITNMGVDVGASFSAPCAGPHPNPACNLGVVGYTTQTVGYIPGPAQVGVWDNLQVLVSFALSGDGDGAALSGIARIDEVQAPEPGLLLLLGAGLIAISVARRAA
jgi:hypothetical protein